MNRYGFGRRTYVVAAVVALLAGLTGFGISEPTLPPCATEDSVSCHWDATVQGNGIGRSFTTDADGMPTYVGAEAGR